MKRTSLLVLLLMMVFGIDAQTRFQKVVGTSMNDRNYHLAAMDDGTLYATGYTESVVGAGREAFVVKYNPFGEVVWAKTYGGPGDETNWDVIVTQNNQLVGAGHSSGLTPFQTGVLTRADSSGVVIWSVGVGHLNGNVNFYRVMETTTGHLVATGLTTMNGTEDILICKFSASGQLLWSRVVATPQDDEIMGMIETTSGHYLFAGLTSDSTGNGGTEFAVVKTDSDGNVLWSKRYGGIGSERLNSVLEHNNAYYFMGWSSQGVIGGNDVVVMQTDTGGVEQWIYAYGTPQTERAFNMLYDSIANALVVTGYTDYSDPVTNNRNTFLMQLDMDGAIQWARSYGSTSTDGHWPTGLAMTDDKGYYLLSSTNTFGPGSYSLYLIKTDGEGHTACHQKDPLFQKDTITGWVGVPFAVNTAVTLNSMVALVTGMPWSLTPSSLCCELYVNGGPDAGVCDSSSVMIGTDPLPGYQYAWHHQGLQMGTSPFQQVDFTHPGSWMVTADAPGSGCAAVSDTVVVTLLPTPPPVTIMYVPQFNAMESSALHGNQWYLNGQALPGDTLQSLIVLVDGYYHVVVTNSYGCQVVSDSVYGIHIGIVGSTYETTHTIFPNPATRQVTIRFGQNTFGATLTIFDLSGRRLYGEQLNQHEAGTEHTVNTSHLPPGMYRMVLQSEEQRTVWPLSIMR